MQRKTDLAKPSRKRLFVYTFRNMMLAAVLIFIALLAGMYGYHVTEKMSWIDSYVNASMILSGMGPLGELNTYEGKLFAGSYALFSGLFFILIIGLILSPLSHYYFKKWHLEQSR